MAGSNVQSPRELAPRRGSDLIGYVVVTGCDNYWWLGVFTPAKDFDKYRQFFDRERELNGLVHQAGEDAYVAASDAWRGALEKINELGMRLGDPGEPIRDFKIDE